MLCAWNSREGQSDARSPTEGGVQGPPPEIFKKTRLLKWCNQSYSGALFVNTFFFRIRSNSGFSGAGSSYGSHLGRFSLGLGFTGACSTTKLSAASTASCLLNLFLARWYRRCTAGDESATLSCPSLIDGAQSGFSQSYKADGLPETM